MTKTIRLRIEAVISATFGGFFLLINILKVCLSSQFIASAKRRKTQTNPHINPQLIQRNRWNDSTQVYLLTVSVDDFQNESIWEELWISANSEVSMSYLLRLHQSPHNDQGEFLWWIHQEQPEPAQGIQTLLNQPAASRAPRWQPIKRPDQDSA